jgi:CRP-like cAMP-binding protein
MDRFDFLSSIHPISSDEYQQVVARLHTRSFKKGESLITAGQVQRQIYFIQSGVQMFHVDKDGKSHVIAFTYYPNLCAIPESFTNQEPSKYNFTCLTDSDINYISFDDMQDIFKRYQNIETLFRKINERLLSGMLNLHVEFRTMSIEERFRAFCRRSSHLLKLVPHKYIASYLGIDATNFSKLFNTVKI